MPVLELSAWIRDYLELEGVKPCKPQEFTPLVSHKSFVFTHRGKLGA
ncbi:hypothetical protein JFL55_01385 [Histophilus somni]|nr:hypothetical protein [Histophilus somni]QQF87095.1 hypothetical protein JFL55_01385 [Histophilus somni]